MLNKGRAPVSYVLPRELVFGLEFLAGQKKNKDSLSSCDSLIAYFGGPAWASQIIKL